MAKKSFKDSARASVASAFMSDSHTYEETQDIAQEVEQDEVQTITQEPPQNIPLVDALEARRPIRTQGRKGKKKPRINMAFEPDIYEYIRAEAEREDKSITQYVNDILYIHMKMHKK